MLPRWQVAHILSCKVAGEVYHRVCVVSVSVSDRLSEVPSVIVMNECLPDHDLMHALIAAWRHSSSSMINLAVSATVGSLILFTRILRNLSTSYHRDRQFSDWCCLVSSGSLSRG